MNEIFYAGLVDECAGTSEPEDAGSRLSIDRFLSIIIQVTLRGFEKENLQFFDWKFFFFDVTLSFEVMSENFSLSLISYILYKNIRFFSIFLDYVKAMFLKQNSSSILLQPENNCSPTSKSLGTNL